MAAVTHTTEVQEVISRPAPWVARYGLQILLVILTALALLAAVYRYPTTLTGTLVLTTVDPPRTLTARNDLTIDRLLVRDRDTVVAGQTLLVATNARATLEHVLALEDRLLEYRAATPDRLLDLRLTAGLLLGPLEEVVATFEQAQERYRNVVDRRLEAYTSTELGALIGQAEATLSSLRAELPQLENAVQRHTAALEREERLREEGLRNGDRLEATQAELRAASERLQAQFDTIRQKSLSIELMQNQIAAYRSGRQGSSQQLAAALRDRFDDLQAAVAGWKRDFTLVSPVSGTIVLQTDTRPGSYLRDGDLVATVLPTDAGSTVGRLRLPVAGTGRLAPGQDVVVRFDRWPSLAYGTVAGRVQTIGVIPTDGSIDVEVVFPHGLRSSTGGYLEGSPLMEGTADVVVDRRRLIQRLLGPK